MQRADLAPEFFGEGITLLKTEVVQLRVCDFFGFWVYFWSLSLLLSMPTYAGIQKSHKLSE